MTHTNIHVLSSNKVLSHLPNSSAIILIQLLAAEHFRLNRSFEASMCSWRLLCQQAHKQENKNPVSSRETYPTLPPTYPWVLNPISSQTFGAYVWDNCNMLLVFLSTAVSWRLGTLFWAVRQSLILTLVYARTRSFCRGFAGILGNRIGQPKPFCRAQLKGS